METCCHRNQLSWKPHLHLIEPSNGDDIHRRGTLVLAEVKGVQGGGESYLPRVKSVRSAGHAPRGWGVRVCRLDTGVHYQVIQRGGARGRGQ